MVDAHTVLYVMRQTHSRSWIALCCVVAISALVFLVLDVLNCLTLVVSPCCTADAVSTADAIEISWHLLLECQYGHPLS